MRSLQSFLKFQLIFLLFAFSSLGSIAHSFHQLVSILVATQHTDLKYKLNEEVVFSALVFKSSNPIKDVNIRYEIGMEKTPPIKTVSMVLKNDQQEISGGKISVPGFLRCTISCCQK
jgi:cephalosporin-C deacetylase